MQVVISRAENEIHVSVPYAWKERAKKIKGYRWHPDLKVWIYPHSRTTFSELVAEFGDDATVKGFEAAVEERPLEQKIGEALETRLKELEARLLVATERAQNDATENHALSAQVSELKNQLAETLAALDSAKKVKPSIEFWIRKAEENERKYREALEQQKPVTPPPPPSTPAIADPFSQLVQRTIAIAKNDPAFLQTVNGSTQSRLPIDLAVAAERKLRAILGKHGNPSTEREDFSTVIREASDKQLIGDEARVLLHFVRQNRNRVAHDQLDQAVLWARSCLALLASSILWPLLDRK